jgi:ribosomal protein L13E
MSRLTDNGLPEIPSEFIEPYLATFMGSMVEFVASAITEEEKAKRNGCGWTVAEIKAWVKGVEVFVSHSCGIHARYAMMNEMYKFVEMPDDVLKAICHKVTYGEIEK